MSKENCKDLSKATQSTLATQKSSLLCWKLLALSRFLTGKNQNTGRWGNNNNNYNNDNDDDDGDDDDDIDIYIDIDNDNVNDNDDDDNDVNDIDIDNDTDTDNDKKHLINKSQILLAEHRHPTNWGD